MTNDEIIKQLLDDGSIRVDLARGLAFSNRYRPTKPLGCVDGYGYLRTVLKFRGKRFSPYVHRIVAIAAYGVPESGLDAAHLNHVKTDNRAKNLAFITRGENRQQTVEAGNQARGEAQHLAKLTAVGVQEIRESYASGGVTQQALADQYGVSRCAILCAVTGKTWKDVPGPITKVGGR